MSGDNDRAGDGHLPVDSDDFADAWHATIEDMEQIAAELEGKGWETLAIIPERVSIESPEMGETDRFGITYVVAEAEAKGFEDAFEPDEVAEYDVYRARVDEQLFLLTSLRDPERASAILIAGHVDLGRNREHVADILAEDEMYTHVESLDGTHLGSVRHGENEKFFPTIAVRR